MKVQYTLGDIIQYVDIGPELEIIRDDNGLTFKSNTFRYFNIKVSDTLNMDIFTKKDIRRISYFNNGVYSDITEMVYDVRNYNGIFTLNVFNGKLSTVLSSPNEDIKHIKLIEL